MGWDLRSELEKEEMDKLKKVLEDIFSVREDQIVTVYINFMGMETDLHAPDLTTFCLTVKGHRRYKPT